MSCGQIALVEEGFEIKDYFASEIEPNAIKVTTDNFPNTKEIGDIMNLVLETKENNEIILNEAKTSCRGGNLQKKVFDRGRPRKLTPNEYRKLQTVPEWYKMNVSNSQIYNMCGDGWTIAVIRHIFKGLK